MSDYFSVLQDSQLDYRNVYLAHCRSQDVYWYDEDCFGPFPYVCAGGNVLDIQAREEASKERMVIVVQVKKWFGVVPVKCKPEPRKTNAETTHAASSVLGF